MPEPVLLTVRDVKARAQIGINEAYALMRQVGQIKLGRSVRIRAVDLDAHLEKLRQRVEP